MSKTIGRRQFLSAATAGAAGAWALTHGRSNLWSAAIAAATGDGRDRNLVVIQLSGGNDGLNTVIPFADEAYHANRFTLRYHENEILKISDYLGWHPSARGLADMLEAGDLAVVQGVGYPNPNRSHFESMDLWQTAHSDERSTGWLGKYADHLGRDFNPACVYVGSGVGPLALRARSSTPLTVRRLDQLSLGNDQTRDFVEQLSASSGEDDALLSAVAGNLESALNADRQLAEALRRSTQTGYPGSQLGEDLRSVATLIRSGLPARVFYVTLDGFDTHANQRGAHAALLEQLASALKALRDDLSRDGLWDRTLVLSFSEFGRRVRENGSQGTDHGVAGPVFMAGGTTRSGLHGDYPSLTDLTEGDLKHGIDYRDIYRSILSDWFKADAAAVLGDQFKGVPGLLG